jgi:SNF2 family DNA or RNA helicase
MGQVRSVQVHFLLCENTVDEAVMQVLEKKQLLFDLYADESTMAQAEETLFDQEWIRAFMEKEHSRYLPAVVV